MSNLLVGLLDREIENSDVVSWDTNKVGGLPVWICTESSLSVPECKICGQASSLISQIYCPLGGSEYHRCIYLFACPGDCSKQEKGWRVFRSMKRDSSYQAQIDQAKDISPQPSKCVDEMWSQEQDDWSEESDKWDEESDEWGETSQILQLHQESVCEPTDKGCSMPCPAALDVAKPGVACHASSTPELNSNLLQSMESLSQLELSDEVYGHGCPADASDNMGVVSCVPPACVAASGDGHQDMEESAVEDMIALADAERWNAMAKLLNTKLEQDSATAKSDSKRAVVFEPYYLSVVNEPVAKEEVSDHINHLIRSYERSEGKQLHTLIADRSTSSKGKEGLSELYEKSELKHGDRHFYKFMKRLQRCPQQCIRYDRRGDPLLVSPLQDQPASQCPHCGGRRIFEFQLLPPLIPFLKAIDDTPCEVEFGTVLVYTCEQNCWPADNDPSCKLDLLEESIVLQGDPDIHLYR